MENSLANLFRLQEIDSEAAELTASIAALPRHLAAVEEKLRTARATVTAIQDSLKAEDAQRRRIESDVKDQQQKIIRFRNQSSSVKNNEQFHALQHEIAFAEKEISSLEDSEIASMERSEALESKLTESQQELKAQTALVEQEKEAAKETTATNQTRLKELAVRRAELRQILDAGLLSTYDLVASSRGSGVARAQGQRCFGCQMFLRPQMWNQVRSGAIATCESCGRLLYFNPALEPAPEPAAPVKAKKKKAEAEEE